MELKEITYIEQYLDEKPKENYWRGITVKIGGMTVFHISYHEDDEHPFFIQSLMFRDRYVETDEGNIDLMPRRSYKTKGFAIREVNRIIERYLKLFMK